MDLTQLARDGKLDPTIGRDDGTREFMPSVPFSLPDITFFSRNSEDYPKYVTFYQRRLAGADLVISFVPTDKVKPGSELYISGGNSPNIILQIHYVSLAHRTARCW